MKTYVFNNYKDACCYAKDEYNSVDFSPNSTIIYLEEWEEEDRFITGRLFSKNTKGFAETFLDKKRDIISTEIVEKYINNNTKKKMLKIKTKYINTFNSHTKIHELMENKSSLVNKLFGKEECYYIIYTTINI